MRSVLLLLLGNVAIGVGRENRAFTVAPDVLAYSVLAGCEREATGGVAPGCAVVVQYSLNTAHSEHVAVRGSPHSMQVR